MFLSLLWESPLLYAMTIIVVILSVSLHEFGHALIAKTQGDETAANVGFLTFNPLRQMGVSALIFLLLAGITWGVTPVETKNLRYGRFSESLVAFAGPFTNLFLMALFVAGFVLLAGNPVLKNNEWLTMFLNLGAQYNAVLFLLNLLPIPPLDGFALVSPWVPLLKQNQATLSQYGFIILVVLFFVLKLGRQLFNLAIEMNLWTYDLMTRFFP